MIPPLPTRVVNRGNLAVSLLTLLAAFLLSLYSLSPSGRHLLFGRAIAQDETESSPLELFLTESNLHHWQAFREPYFVQNRTDLVRVRLPAPASNFSLAVASLESLVFATTALAEFFEFPQLSVPTLHLSTLYKHVLLRQRFEMPTSTAAGVRQGNATASEAQNVLVVCRPVACPVTSTMIAFQRLTRRQAWQRLAVFTVALNVTSDAARAVDSEWRANGAFTVVGSADSGAKARRSQLPAIVGALPSPLPPGVRRDPADTQLYDIIASGAELQKVRLLPFSDIEFSRRRTLRNTSFSVVHLNVDGDMAIASLAYMTGLAQEATEALLPTTVVLPLHVTQWADAILTTVSQLQAQHGYHVYAVGGNATRLDSSDTLVSNLRGEVAERMAPSLLTYWSHSAPLCYLILSRNVLTPVVDALPLSTLSQSHPADFFSAEQEPAAVGGDSTAEVGLDADLYPFNDGALTQPTTKDVAGKLGGLLYQYLAVVVPMAMYAVPVVICVVLLRNLARRRK